MAPPAGFTHTINASTGTRLIPGALILSVYNQGYHLQKLLTFQVNYRDSTLSFCHPVTNLTQVYLKSRRLFLQIKMLDGWTGDSTSTTWRYQCLGGALQFYNTSSTFYDARGLGSNAYVAILKARGIITMDSLIRDVMTKVHQNESISSKFIM